MDCLDQLYCCFTCAKKFRAGEAIAADVLRCPNCCSVEIHPVDMGTVVLDEYYGPVGVVN